ncbi:MutS family DNA mismatch repair protein [Candidatus Contubernalis alkaliaceticus]|uniref:MutS family DNA mismatch repair protein n=1 Tax=Candidatus Contubernalis alkaliaceticus TaxID=338645 RepID=UPI001F4C171B|nr:MutS family DNA mismatch repair protein [Candidatus Contubernalis alkalaceticus]UNC91026.1 DNA mismatch repair protein MutS [Candidatus Contubernalis alkalaceticus]
MKKNIGKVYSRKQQNYQNELNRTRKKSGKISTMRLTSFLLASSFLGYGYYGPYDALMYFALPFLAAFIFFIVQHGGVKQHIDYLEKLIYINKMAIERLDGKWTSFPEDGVEYTDPGHPYSTDLNLFGQGSLFQHINSTSSFRGEKTLVEHLSSPRKFEEIRPRQQAVLDLASRLDFRQHFQAAGMDTFFKQQDPEEIAVWVEKGPFWSNRPEKSAVLFLPFFTFLLFGLAAVELIPFWPALIMLTLQVGIALVGEKEAQQNFKNTDIAVRRIARYVDLMRRIEQENFKASFLKDLKKKLFPGELGASYHIKTLVDIADRNNLRFSSPLIYYPLNIFVFWDLRTLKKLEGWRKNWGISIRGWFDAVGEIEALSSLAGLYHDHPHWIFPMVKNAPPAFQARNLAHPLIPSEERVENDLTLPRPGTIFVITGSNMSGKSTLLRTIGINLVLAYAGAPVCASEMTCSLMQIYSKMQIHDNLEERVSTFYAELKRMKMIIDAAQKKEPLIFLLDEIFRGTNSRDRIKATRTVTRQLYILNTVGLITTHDLELGAMEKEYPGFIKNYHFTDEIYDGRIHFDYKIKSGISQTANAVTLMKMVGIQVEEEKD